MIRKILLVITLIGIAAGVIGVVRRNEIDWSREV